MADQIQKFVKQKKNNRDLLNVFYESWVYEMNFLTTKQTTILTKYFNNICDTFSKKNFYLMECLSISVFVN